jgi:hypothetical protein
MSIGRNSRRLSSIASSGWQRSKTPSFCAAQAMRLPTFGKPRVISCAELLSKHIALPRDCINDLLGLLRDVGIAPDLRDERQRGTPIEARFLGELTPEQERAAKAPPPSARQSSQRR